MDLKYGEKPEQLGSIKKNTRRLFCSIRQSGCMRILILRYKRQQKDEEEMSGVQKSKVSQIPNEQAALEGKTKKAKEPKALPDKPKPQKLKACCTKVTVPRQMSRLPHETRDVTCAEAGAEGRLPCSKLEFFAVEDYEGPEAQRPVAVLSPGPT